jgi:rRNA maturation RNase YbeY
MASINFYSQDIPFKIPKPLNTKRWIQQVIKLEEKKLDQLNYIFCSDQYLLHINKQYLNHNTFTDIITFDNSEDPEAIEADVFVSIDRVRDNALKLDNDFDEELHRVLVHGILHLSGHSDKSKRAKMLMRRKEDAYLSLRK